jgi:hypothetical protein
LGEYFSNHHRIVEQNEFSKKRITEYISLTGASSKHNLDGKKKTLKREIDRAKLVISRIIALLTEESLKHRGSNPTQGRSNVYDKLA